MSSGRCCRSSWIDRGHPVTAGVEDPGAGRRMLPEIPGEGHHLDPLVTRREHRQYFRRAIYTSVIHEDRFRAGAHPGIDAPSRHEACRDGWSALPDGPRLNRQVSPPIRWSCPAHAHHTHQSRRRMKSRVVGWDRRQQADPLYAKTRPIPSPPVSSRSPTTLWRGRWVILAGSALAGIGAFVFVLVATRSLGLEGFSSISQLWNCMGDRGSRRHVLDTGSDSSPGGPDREDVDLSFIGVDAADPSVASRHPGSLPVSSPDLRRVEPRSAHRRDAHPNSGSYATGKARGWLAVHGSPCA